MVLFSMIVYPWTSCIQLMVKCSIGYIKRTKKREEKKLFILSTVSIKQTTTESMCIDSWVKERRIRVMNSTVNVEFPLREPKTIQEMADLVHNTVIQIQERFGQVSDSILTKGMTNWFGIDFFFLKFFI